MKSGVVDHDCKEFAETFPLADFLKSKTFIITGATGLIGRTIIRCLTSLNYDIRVIAPVRDKARALDILGSRPNVTIVECDLTFFFNKTTTAADYIIHCASPTNGHYISTHPVEVMGIAFESTKAALEYCRRYNCRGMVYLSSVEFYGEIHDCENITETTTGHIDFDSPRSSYPVSKQCAEMLCKAYAWEYGINVTIGRLTQTFGAGVDPTDTRVFAQFAKSILSGNDIVLHTTGESAKPYCYTTDAVSAILFILLKGVKGESYNIANPETYISIMDLAEFLCNRFSPSTHISQLNNPNAGYAPVTKLHLNTERLERLGWKARIGLENMFVRYLDYLKELPR